MIILTGFNLELLFRAHRKWDKEAKEAKTDEWKRIAETHEIHFRTEIERRADLLPIEVVMNLINAAA